MKKTLSFLLTILICICFVGCSKSTDHNSNSLSPNSSSNSSKAQTSSTNPTIQKGTLKINNNYFYEDWKTVDVQSEKLKNVIDYSFYDKLFITAEGDLYKIGNFSDGTNLKKIGDGIRFVKFSKGHIISDDNKVYFYNDSKFSVELDDGRGYLLGSQIPNADYLNSIHAVTSLDQGLAKTAYLENNHIFFHGETDPLFTFEDNEKMEYFVDTTFKTDKGFYYFDYKVNVSQYDDVPTTISYIINEMHITDENIYFIKYDMHCECDMPSICIIDKEGHLLVYNSARGG